MTDIRFQADADAWEVRQDWLSDEGWHNLNVRLLLSWDDWISETDLDAYYFRRTAEAPV